MNGECAVRQGRCAGDRDRCIGRCVGEESRLGGERGLGFYFGVGFFDFGFLDEVLFDFYYC